MDADFGSLEAPAFQHQRAELQYHLVRDIFGEVQLFREAVLPNQEGVSDKDTLEVAIPDPPVGVASEHGLRLPSKGVLDIHFHCILELPHFWHCAREADGVPV